MQYKFLNKNGFTLIELLVVISLIGILATLVIANVNSARERARDAARKSDMKNIQTALRIYYNDYNEYPGSTADFKIIACGGASPATCEWDSAWSRSSVVYMNKIPGDPMTGRSYIYVYINDDDYTLKSCLENKSDETGETETDTTWCPSGWRYQVKP